MPLRPILEVASELGVAREHVVAYGEHKAKLRPGARASGRPPGKLVLVSAITPTAAGEGKTTVAIGLTQGLRRIGQRAAVALREPSLGPILGKKGGGTGGGRCTVEPSTDINLHFTGDFHAVGTAHNLLAALLDNHLHHGNARRIDPRRVFWRRVVDLGDRALRNVVVGLGGTASGVPRETGFDITPASEVMAVLCLAEDEADLRQRLARLLVALGADGAPVTAADLDAVGVMMALLRDALLPNLVQTSEGAPAFVHGGPFANIAHGCNSVIATKMALALSDWVVTEAGFGFDLGAEKFFDIKCRSAGLDTAAVVLVATVRALKLHGGVPVVHLLEPDASAVERGLANLVKHVENIWMFGEAPVVALNRFPSDTADEIDVVRRACERLGVPMAVSDGFERGGEGCVALAEAVVKHAESRPSPFRPLYELQDSFDQKLEKIARLMYGAGRVRFTHTAERDLAELRRLGLAGLPVCVAKSPISLSDDPELLGRPAGFDITVRNVLVAAGAGFVIPLIGDILRMPGLPARPRAEAIDLIDGEIVGV